MATKDLVKTKTKLDNDKPKAIHADIAVSSFVWCILFLHYHCTQDAKRHDQALA